MTKLLKKFLKRKMMIFYLISTIFTLDIYIYIFFSAVEKANLIPENPSNIFYSSGLITLKEIYINEYSIALNSNGKNIDILCSGIVQTFGRNNFCRIDRNVAKLINGRIVTVGWYQIPKKYWYSQSDKQLYSISINNQNIYHKLSTNSEVLKKRKYTLKLIIFTLLLIGNFLIFYLIFYDIRYSRKY